LIPGLKFFRRNPLLENSFWSLGSGLVDRFSALLVLIVLARVLGKEDYGVFLFLITTLNLIANTIISGPANIFISEIARSRQQSGNKISGVIAMGVFWCAMIGMLIIVLTLSLDHTIALFLDPGQRLSSGMVRVIGPWAALVTLAATFTAVLQGYEWFGRMFFASLGKAVINLVLCIVLALFYGIWGAILAFVLTLFIYVMILNGLSRKANRWRLRDGGSLLRSDRPYVSSIVRLSTPLIILSLVQMSADWGGQFLLAKGGGQWSAVAELGVARQIAFIMPVLSSAVATAGLPYFSKKVNDEHASYFASVVNYIRTNWFMQIPIGAILICTAPYVISILYGNRLAGAADICRVLVISYTIFGITGAIGPVLTSKGKTLFLLGINLLRSVTILLFCYLFLDYGGTGIALGYLAGECAVLLLLSLVFFNYVRDILHSIGTPLLQSLPLILVAALSFFLTPPVAVLCLIIAILVELFLFRHLIRDQLFG